jgi:hypothetical protein
MKRKVSWRKAKARIVAVTPKEKEYRDNVRNKNVFQFI